MRKVSSAELEKIRSTGRQVSVKKPALKEVKEAPKEAPKPDNNAAMVADALTQQAKLTRQISDALGEGQAKLAEQMMEMMRENQSRVDRDVKPIPYRFKIERDKRGLLTGGEFHPIIEG